MNSTNRIFKINPESGVADSCKERQSTQKQVYTVSEISKILYIGINQAYELVKNNAPFTVIKVRNQYRIPKLSFDEWLLGQKP